MVVDIVDVHHCRDDLDRIHQEIFLKRFHTAISCKEDELSSFERSEKPKEICPSDAQTNNYYQIAYGRLGIPKLVKETMSSDQMIAFRALNTITDLLYDPEKVVAALHSNIIKRLLLLISGKKEFICLSALGCLKVLCKQPNGKQAVLANECSLPILKKTLRDSKPDIRFNAIFTVHQIADNYTGIGAMVQAGYIEVVLDLINNYDNPLFVTKELLEILELLLDNGDKAKVQAITCDVLDIVGLLSIKSPSVKRAAASVIARLFQCPIGKMAAIHRDVIKKIKLKLKDPDEVFTSKLVAALMFATTDLECRKVANDISIMVAMLDIISDTSIGTELELTAVKVLTNLAELPEVRVKLRFFLGIILSLSTHDREDIQRHINTLIDTILWKP